MRITFFIFVLVHCLVLHAFEPALGHNAWQDSSSSNDDDDNTDDDDGFTCFAQTKKCYKAIPDNVTQLAASEQCRRMDAQLASIHSHEENDFILGLITKPKDPYWIGMVIYRSVNDNDRIVGASWMDGSAVDYGHPIKGVGTKPWSVLAQPDNFWKSKPENCVQLYRGTEFPIGWYDDNCGYAFFGYICQKRQPRSRDKPVLPNPIPSVDNGRIDKANFSCFTSTSKCYKVVMDSINQAGAEEQCFSMNATLSSVHSQAEYDRILKLIAAVNGNATSLYWIGMVIQRDLANDGMVGVGWLDGSAVYFGNPMLKQKNSPWVKGEPNNEWKSRPENCVAIRFGVGAKVKIGWFDVNCGILGGFVCQKKL